MRVKLRQAKTDDARATAKLRAAVALDLTSRYGKGHWSSAGSEKGVLYDIRTSRVFVATKRNGLIATLRLSSRKPWAIDTKYFSQCANPLYLTNMAVDPAMQGQGIGRLCMEEVRRIAEEWPADAIRLDAYDAEAGAGAFYRKCGFREVGRTSYRNTPLIYLELMLFESK
jgi:ribosomal protein S18 acetylase RimI-like enzyme